MSVAEVVPLPAQPPDGVGNAAAEPVVGKLAAQVARRIETDIIGRGWPVGESLGSEPELRERYGVSRSVLREAVRLVEHHQVARMRRGPNGGLFIAAPDAGPAARAMVIYLEYVGTSVDDLMQARRLLEPLAAGLAATRVTEKGIELIRVTRDADTTSSDSLGDSVEDLHLILGELSANPVLQLFIDVLIRLTTRYAAGPQHAPQSAYRKARAEARRYHADIAEAVIAGDAGRAEALLAEYLDGVLTWMRSNRRSGARSEETITHRPADQDPRAKLAEVVAGALRDDIVAAGWPVGTVIGSESDLLERYGISRAVLREAVRLLEYHSVASMRRGPGGGLVVGIPDPQASIDTMALYLEYRKVTAQDLLSVREAVELGLITRVTARSDDPAIAAQLEAAIRWGSEWPDDDPARSDLFHTELARLAGNPVLALFLRILTELWHRHAAGRRPTDRTAATATVEHVHRRIAEAVLAGDDGLARHRLRRHLEALTEWWH